MEYDDDDEEEEEMHWLVKVLGGGRSRKKVCGTKNTKNTEH